MNVFQHGVLNGLGWVAVLADGWILHTHWLATAGFLLLVWSAWHIQKGIDMTIEDGFNGTTADDLVKAVGWRKRQIEGYRAQTWFCAGCLKECSVTTIDEGIGSYEYWGATGVDIRLVEVSDCCEEELLDELPEEDGDEAVA